MASEEPIKSPLLRVAMDVSRHVASGARVKIDEQQTRPFAMLAGRQAAGTPTQLAGTVVFEIDGGNPVECDVQSTHVASTAGEIARTLADGSFYTLRPAPPPTWVFHTKSFSFPSLPIPEDEVRWEDAGAATNMLAIRLTAAALREANSGRGRVTDPAMALCTVHKKPEDPDGVEFNRVGPEFWRPAMILRCPMLPRSRDGDPSLLFELKGVPQSERWYLDRLGLLIDKDLPEGSEVDLFLESIEEGKARDVKPIPQWTLARRNLTSLARPGETILLTQNATRLTLPYVATDAELTDTLRLIQMASITNSGGYFLRGVPTASNPITSPSPTAAQINLIVVVRFPAVAAQNNALRLPLAANAVAVVQDVDPLKRIEVGLVQFDGSEHVQIEPYAPPGCLAIGLRRDMGWPAPSPDPDNRREEESLTRAEGFAESVHLVDIEVRDKRGAINLYRPHTGASCDGQSKDGWCETLSAGHSASPLFPMDPSRRGERDPQSQFAALGAGVGPAAAHLRPTNGAAAGLDDATSHSHEYRTIVRFAYKDVFTRLADPLAREITVVPCLRDLYGNRIAPLVDGSMSQKLTYTDPLIAPLEWPGFHFGLSAVKEHKGWMTLHVDYREPDSPLYYAANILQLRPLAQRLTTPGADRVATYLSLRLSEPMRQWLAEMTAEPATPPRGTDAAIALVRELNQVINGESIHQPDRFADVVLSDETNDLIAHGIARTPRETSRLNRLLLDDAYARGPLFMLTPTPKARSPIERRQHLRRLQLIRDQLRGAAPSGETSDVQVRLRDEDDDPQHPAVYIITPSGFDLRIQLLHLLDRILRGDNVDALSLSFEYSRTSGTRPERFSPLLEIERTQYLPKVDQLTANPALNDRIQEQIKRAASIVAIIPSPNAAARGTTGRAEFREIARQFQLPGCVTAIARNRYNEHELWFMSEAALPKVQPGVANLYATARPLSNRLGAARFAVPDFSKPDPAGWEGAAMPAGTTQFVDIDYDACAREFFNLLEVMTTPQAVTARGKETLWKNLLAAKESLAEVLADEMIVSMFVASDVPNRAGLTRMGQDAFKRDVRNFYRIDTFAGLAIHVRSAATEIGISNIYASTELILRDHVDPLRPTPRVSDIVFNVNDDWRTSVAGRATLTYDLPPGEESNWSNWNVKAIRAQVSHVQLPDPNDLPTARFDRGLWLELVPESPHVLQWDQSKPIPAIVRQFPPKPALESVDHVPPDNRALEKLPPNGFGPCGGWGWRVKFKGDPSGQVGNDTAYLKVEYFSGATANHKSLALTSSLAKPYQNLLEALIVANAMAKAYCETPVVDQADDRWIAAAAVLAADIANFLRPNVATFATDSQGPIDRFALRLARKECEPHPENACVKRATLTGAGEGPYIVEALANDAGNLLHLLNHVGGADPLRSFKIELSLRRNNNIPINLGDTGLVVDPRLVYECGPFAWPSEVRPNNTFHSIEVDIPRGEALSKIVGEVLSSLLGSADLEGLSIRIDAKHAFKLAHMRMTSPQFLYSQDYAYQSTPTISADLTKAYLDWYKVKGSLPSTVATGGPELLLAVHLSVKSDVDASRSLVAIEQIVIPLAGVKLS